MQTADPIHPRTSSSGFGLHRLLKGKHCGSSAAKGFTMLTTFSSGSIMFIHNRRYLKNKITLN